MNRITTIISLFSVLVLSSCGVDRTDEYEQLTKHNIWMYEQMKDKYLWADNLSEQTWKTYFATPSDYFTKLISCGSNDDGSYIIIDSLSLVDPHQRGNFNHKASYGFDYVVITDPTSSTTKSYARVKTVYPDSPAEKAGLKRNDFIETFDGNKLNSSNSSKLQYGTAHKLVVRKITSDAETNECKWESSDTIQLGDSTYVEDNAFPVSTVVAYNDEKVGYLMCTRLLEAPTAEENGNKTTTDYKTELDQKIATFKAANINNFILDLRLCNFGTLEMARHLGSLIIPSASQSKVFAKTTWNTANTASNESFTFDTSLADKTLDLDYVVVIVSDYTKGAAEWLIRGLQYALGEDNVLIVGQSTAGQEFMTQFAGDYDNMIHIYPAVAFVANGNDDYGSSESGVIKPDVEIDEFSSVYLYDYGSTDEVVLNQALYSLYHPEERTSTDDTTTDDTSSDDTTTEETASKRKFLKLK